MFRTNDPFWSRQAVPEGLMGQDQRCCGRWCWSELGVDARMALTGSQIGPFMKQSQTDFMNGPG
jgi:hypothetical protein